MSRMVIRESWEFDGHQEHRFARLTLTDRHFRTNRRSPGLMSWDGWRVRNAATSLRPLLAHRRLASLGPHSPLLNFTLATTIIRDHRPLNVEPWTTPRKPTIATTHAAQLPLVPLDAARDRWRRTVSRLQPPLRLLGEFGPDPRS